MFTNPKPLCLSQDKIPHVSEEPSFNHLLS